MPLGSDISFIFFLSWVMGMFSKRMLNSHGVKMSYKKFLYFYYSDSDSDLVEWRIGLDYPPMVKIHVPDYSDKASIYGCQCIGWTKFWLSSIYAMTIPRQLSSWGIKRGVTHCSKFKLNCRVITRKSDYRGWGFYTFIQTMETGQF